VTDELLERYRRGERPALTDYVGRYPALAEQIRELFSALVLMEDVRPGSKSPADRPVQARAGDVPFQHLGDYRIVREIGRGGMGIVYEAEQESLGRRVALKVLPPGALAAPKQVQRFQQEARAAARLHHTHIVPVFGVGEENGTHYYVMQYIEGRPLDEVLAELRRLRTGADAGGGQAPDRASAGVDAGSCQNATPGAGPPSSIEVARSLWEGRFRAACLQDPAEAIDPDGVTQVGDAARPPARQAANPASSDSGTARTSSLLSNPHRPYAESVAQVGVQAADALEYAAGQGILHRDVKPSNLLLDVWGSVWLTDFGLAKATGTPDLTRTGDLLGTLRYMAPERFQGRADVRSDVYALGLTLYEALALRPAFDDHGQAKVIHQITTSEPPRLDQLNPHLPRDLVTIVHKSIAKDPSDRYQTAGALAEDLGRFLDDRPIAARRLSVLEKAWRWGRRNPTAAALLAALLTLVALAVTGGVWWQRQQGERREREARARQGVEAALEQAAGLRLDDRWPEANAVLQQAQGRLDDAALEGAAADDLRRRLGQARAELELAVRLEEIWLERSTISDGKPNLAAADRAYAAAFGKAGLDVTGDLAVIAARVRESAIQGELISALDDWAYVTRDEPMRAQLLRLARLADPDPKWRDRFRQPAVWRDRAAMERLAVEAPVGELSSRLLAILGRVLSVQPGADAEPLLRSAQQRYPDCFWLNLQLGGLLFHRQKLEQAVGFYRAALARRPRSGVAYSNLGLALKDLGQLEEALASCRRAVELNPNSAWFHNNLGNVLRRAGRGDEAIAAYRRAIELAPELAPAHNNLGGTLQAQGRRDEAIDHYRQALQLDPKLVQAHHNLGNVLQKEGRLDEAIDHYQQALQLDPKLAQAHHNLGLALFTKGRRDEAIDHYRQALGLNPKFAPAHHNLGNALCDKGEWEEAIAAYRRATELDPKQALSHLALGQALLRQGCFGEARTATQRSLSLMPDDDPRRQQAQHLLGECERLLGLDARLAVRLEGKAQPAEASEQRDLARLCQDHKRCYAAARFYAAAFAAQPKLADDLGTQDRYNAACAAALAAAGHGADAAKLGDAERARLRRQALEWLTADLAAWDQRIKDHPQERVRVQKALRHWQADRDLAGIRDTEALAQLPPAEREACRKLWAEVDALLQRAGSPK
jgi:serine/threonine protein kinase/Tfp pilus assembly protein PilF